MTQHPTEPAKVAQGGSEAAGTDILAIVDAVTEGVTEGPWEQNGTNGVHTTFGSCIATTHQVAGRQRKDDARFIAASRTLVPVLRDEIERLRGEKQLVEVELAMEQDGFARWKSRADAAEVEVERLRGALNRRVALWRADIEGQPVGNYELALRDAIEAVEALLRGDQ